MTTSTSLSPRQRRLQRARVARQGRFLLERFGVLQTPEGPLGAAEWRERNLRSLSLRLTDKAVWGRQNALRAADIVRHSTSHAGSDTHGILHYLLRWRDEGRTLSAVLQCELKNKTR